MFMLVAHFRVAQRSGPGLPSDALEPLAMLAASPECDRLHFARSTDWADKFVLVAEFESAAAYRRAISPWPMRMTVIPWLSSAELDHTEVSEVMYSAVAGEVLLREPTVPEPGR